MADAVARISVALVDDQPLFRAGLRMLIESQADMEFAGEADDGEQAVALAADVPPDVMLMDLYVAGLVQFPVHRDRRHAAQSVPGQGAPRGQGDAVVLGTAAHAAAAKAEQD